MTGPVPAEPRIPGWITDPDVIKSIKDGLTETFEDYSARDELVGLRAAHALVVGERDGLRRRVHQLLTQRGPVTACDDCPGRSDCRCADGHTDTTDCTCGEGTHR